MELRLKQVSKFNIVLKIQQLRRVIIHRKTIEYWSRVGIQGGGGSKFYLKPTPFYFKWSYSLCTYYLWSMSCLISYVIIDYVSHSPVSLRTCIRYICWEPSFQNYSWFLGLWTSIIFLYFSVFFFDSTHTTEFFYAPIIETSFFPNLPCLFSTFHLKSPSVLSRFCFSADVCC